MMLTLTQSSHHLSSLPQKTWKGFLEAVLGS